MPRLFVAVDLPPEAKRAAASLCQGLPGVRWLPADQLHLTLRFIGEVNEPLFAAIRDGLLVSGLSPMVCRLQGVGRFPPSGRPRVLWVGVHSEGDGLLQLATLVEERLRLFGLAPEGRQFRPHVTLARLKDISAALVTPYLQVNERFLGEPFTVQEFHLYQSLLTAPGAIHNLACSYPLDHPACSKKII